MVGVLQTIETRLSLEVLFPSMPCSTGISDISLRWQEHKFSLGLYSTLDSIYLIRFWGSTVEQQIIQKHGDLKHFIICRDCCESGAGAGEAGCSGSGPLV